VQAVRREAFEELGLDVHVEFILGTTHFYRGDALPRMKSLGYIMAALSLVQRACDWVTSIARIDG
jgi:ADP-ribose pyrophosphatase YjhB (NUDIX family)